VELLAAYKPLVDEKRGREIETYDSFAGLAVLDANRELLKVNILGRQGEGLSEPQPAAPQDCDQCPVPSTAWCSLRTCAEKAIDLVVIEQVGVERSFGQSGLLSGQKAQPNAAASTSCRLLRRAGSLDHRTARLAGVEQSSMPLLISSHSSRITAKPPPTLGRDMYLHVRCREGLQNGSRIDQGGGSAFLLPDTRWSWSPVALTTDSPRPQGCLEPGLGTLRLLSPPR
jgi:hypothetical protein